MNRIQSWAAGIVRAGLAPIFVVLLAVVCPVQAHSQEHGGHSSAHHEKNTLGIFVGAATVDRRDKGAALGIEYERRINRAFGIGALVERTFGAFDTTVFAVPFALHSGPWKAYIAPGIEDGLEGSENLLRVGVEYGFKSGEWEISPQFDLDFVDGDYVAVLGVVFATGF